MASESPFLEPNKRKWQPREMLMLAEYLVKAGLTKNTWQRAKLGALHPDLAYPGLTAEELAALHVHRRWADAIHFDDDEVIIIEAKIRSMVGAISQLKLYKMLFLSDPQYTPHHNKKIILQLVYAIEDPVVNRLAIQEGIEVVRFVPDWLPEYMAILQPRERVAPKTVI